MGNGFLADAPLWLIGLALFAGLMLSAWAGMELHNRTKRTRGNDPSEGYLLSATLALLGLLIAFTFSLALSRYDARRALVVTEANAIGTAWLRAGLADGPQGEALRQSLRAYADIRLRLPVSGDPAAVEAASGRAQAVVWERLKAALPGMSQPIAATLVTAANEMFDVATSRRAERNARIPTHVLGTLILYALMAAGIVGYVLGGTGRRHGVVTTILFLLLALAVTLILDLDRPWSGGITISQAPMEAARAAMR